MTAVLYHKKLARVLDRMGGLYTFNDILTAIAKGKMQSFVEGNSWVVTQIAAFPRQRAIEIVAAVGDLHDLRIIHDRILDFADKENAGVIIAFGRKGWLPDALTHGWKLKARNFVYHREL